MPTRRALLQNPGLRAAQSQVFNRADFNWTAFRFATMQPVFNGRWLVVRRDYAQMP